MKIVLLFVGVPGVITIFFCGLALILRRMLSNAPELAPHKRTCDIACDKVWDLKLAWSLAQAHGKVCHRMVDTSLIGPGFGLTVQKWRTVEDGRLVEKEGIIVAAVNEQAGREVQSLIVERLRTSVGFVQVSQADMWMFSGKVENIPVCSQDLSKDTENGGL